MDGCSLYETSILDRARLDKRERSSDMCRLKSSGLGRVSKIREARPESLRNKKGLEQIVQWVGICLAHPGSNPGSTWRITSGAEYQTWVIDIQGKHLTIPKVKLEGLPNVDERLDAGGCAAPGDTWSHEATGMELERAVCIAELSPTPYVLFQMALIHKLSSQSTNTGNLGTGKKKIKPLHTPSFPQVVQK